jgi:type III secretion system YscQ/HrcQ family protein
MGRRISYQSRAVRTYATPRPYPWAALESTTRAEVEGIRGARRGIESFVRLRRLDDAVARLLGCPVEARVRRVQSAPSSRPIDGGSAVVLSLADGGTEGEFRVEAEAALVAAAVARAVGRSGPRFVLPAASGAQDLAGAFAAIVAAAARQAHAGVALRVVSAGLVPPPLEPPSLDATGDGGHLALTLTVVLDDEAYAARIVFSKDLAARAADAEWTRDSLLSLGDMRLSMALVAWGCHMTSEDANRLRPGDVLLAPWPLRRDAASAATWSGRVWLASPHADSGVRAELVEGSKLVLRGGPDLLHLLRREKAMNDTEAGDALVTALGDVPVVVRVEIGEAALPAREWAALARGDVIALGRRVNERVVLRVGGVPVARGELVEIDGEVGVRIAERIGGDTSP